MKKLSKILACIALIFGMAFSVTACSIGEVTGNTKTAIDAATSVIPVEYSQETAEGIRDGSRAGYLYRG